MNNMSGIEYLCVDIANNFVLINANTGVMINKTLEKSNESMFNMPRK